MTPLEQAAKLLQMAAAAEDLVARYRDGLTPSNAATIQPKIDEQLLRIEALRAGAAALDPTTP